MVVDNNSEHINHNRAFFDDGEEKPSSTSHVAWTSPTTLLTMTGPITLSTRTLNAPMPTTDFEKKKMKMSITSNFTDAAEEYIDPWDVAIEEDTTIKWSDLTAAGKVLRVVWITLRIVLILAALYSFICSLDVLQDAFHMLSGRSAGSLFSNSKLTDNPVSAMMIGVFVTVIVQSSSTSSAIVISMVASGVLTVEKCIPIIMGANIGTTVTNTIVALTQSTNRDIFRRAFAGATVHDAFNWLNVLILLPLECATGYLYHLTEAMTKDISPKQNAENPQFLKVITDPLTKLIIQVDHRVILAIAENSDRQKFPLAKYWAKEISQDYSFVLPLNGSTEECDKVNKTVFTYNVNCTTDNSSFYLSYTKVLEENSTKCVHLFVGAGLEGYITEVATGAILLAGSILVMTFCLIALVKILNSLFKGPMTGIVRSSLNANFPGCFSYFTGYAVMLVGAIITVLFQSSSVFTSSLTPLVGMGLITVERVYPLTLGSNIGTTVTAMLAAFTADAEMLKYTIQIALVHLFFNVSGIILFYPIPFMRVPIPIAKMLGNTTANYRWFAIFYLITMFGVFPLVIFGLSLAGKVVFMAIGIPLLILFAFVVVVNILQSKKPHWLPKSLRTWDFLPKPLHSLEPYDRVLSNCACCKRCDEQKIREAIETDPTITVFVESASSSECSSPATRKQGFENNFFRVDNEYPVLPFYENVECWMLNDVAESQNNQNFDDLNNFSCHL